MKSEFDGYAGEILEVDLTEGKVKRIPLDRRLPPNTSVGKASQQKSSTTACRRNAIHSILIISWSLPLGLSPGRLSLEAADASFRRRALQPVSGLMPTAEVPSGQR